jgi:hypothetical protein
MLALDGQDKAKKTAYPGSIPGVASNSFPFANFVSRLKGLLTLTCEAPSVFP